jgi:tRNA threonylcarbamoyladenosine biosynthesis protein TsaB
MALILNLETASTNCSVCLAKNGKVLAIREENKPSYSHAEQLHPFMEVVLDRTGTDLGRLDAIAVSKGPGSYTGLRIGVSAAKGLCFALNIPLLSHATLKAMALQFPGADGLLVPMLDARRMEVYAAVYSSELREIRPTRAEIIGPGSFKELAAEQKVFLLGSGARKCREVLTHPNFRFHEDVVPSSREMAEGTFEQFRSGEFEDSAYFEPYYLKDFIPGSGGRKGT